MSLLDALGLKVPLPSPPMGETFAAPNTRPRDWQIATVPTGGAWGNPRPAVGGSEDLDRILALPRRPRLDLDADRVRVDALVTLMTGRLARPRPHGACACASMHRPCITRLLPSQAWTLYELGIAGGILGAIGVGHGKTGLDILAPMVLEDCRVAVLLVPSNLVKQLERDYLAWREHFRVPSLVIKARGYIAPPGPDGKAAPVIHVVPFSIFSRPESTALLESIRPDAIIIDEAHKARNPSTATTGRLLRYFAAHPDTRLCAWSGTLTSKSITDYAHLAAFSLRKGSPLPLDPNTVKEWAQAIDPSDWPAPMGSLVALCRAGETLYSGFNRRLTETRGVIATRSSATTVVNNLHRRDVTLPPAVKDALRTLRSGDVENGWQRPDGEELVDILAMTSCATQLALGFFYRWKFPKGEPTELIDEWFRKRKAWCKELRQKLKDRREHLDSDKLCENAAARYHAHAVDCRAGFCYCPPSWARLPKWNALTWPAWAEIKDAVYHESEAVWLDDAVAHDAAEWAKKHRGIVWYADAAFGERVAALSGLPLHRGGPGAAERIAAVDGKTSIIASIDSHGTGRDGLQLHFHQQLISSPPASADALEQLLGRLDRIGQNADEVDTWMYMHTEEMEKAFGKSIRRAKYIEGTLDNLQKILAANVTFDLPEG